MSDKNMDNNEPLVQVEGLKKYFPITGGVFLHEIASIKAVDGVSFSIRRGETLGLVGESGCGKSTLGRLLMRLLEPSGGQVFYRGKDIGAHGQATMRELRRNMGIIFQDPFSSLNPRKNVAHIVGEPLLLNGVKNRRKREERVAELLGLVGLKPEHMRRFPHQFSGGQRQRLSVARALALNPELIICDEAVSALDVSIQAQVINLLMDLQEQFGLTYLFISHDLSVVEQISDRVAVMYLGKIMEIAQEENLYMEPMHYYTQALLSAAPKPQPGLIKKRTLLRGDVPSPIAPPPGCRFHTRCPYAEDVCSSQEPGLHEVRPDHFVACHFAGKRPSLYEVAV
jgi:oligopeptide/dipeptide ABC transporter ATP-binding protein